MREKRYRERNPMPLSDACNRRLFSTRTFFYTPLSLHARGCIFLSFYFFYRRVLSPKVRNGLFLVGCASEFVLHCAENLFATSIRMLILYTTFYFNFIFYEYFETFVLFSWLAPVTAAASVCKERINCSHFL